MVWITKHDKEEDSLGRCVPALQLQAEAANTNLEHSSALSINSKACPVRLSAIICTMGIASREVDILEQMIESGMNIALMHFAYGTHEYHRQVLGNIRTAANNYNDKQGTFCPLAVGLLTRGAIIRTEFPYGGKHNELIVYEGDQIQMKGIAEYQLEDDFGKCMYVNYGNIQRFVQVGCEIYLGRRRVVLLCTGIEDVVITCTVLKPGEIKHHQQVHLPGLPVDLPAMSETEKEELRFAVENQVDIIFVAFVREGTCMKAVRDQLGPEGEHIMLVASIENQQAVENIDEIIEASDAISISRSELCDEMADEKVFLAQKSIIRKCNVQGKPVVVASQLLHSMLTSIRPTRAEFCDIANVVLDGADGILLHHATSRGYHPVEVVKISASICKQAEAAVWQKRLFYDLTDQLAVPLLNVHAIANAAVIASFQLLASAIVVLSASLKSAHFLTQYRPKCPIIAVTRNVKRARQAHMFRGIIPLVYKSERAANWTKDVNLRIYHGINFGRRQQFIKPGDPVVVLVASQQGAGFADTMSVTFGGHMNAIEPALMASKQIAFDNIKWKPVMYERFSGAEAGDQFATTLHVSDALFPDEAKTFL